MPDLTKSLTAVEADRPFGRVAGIDNGSYSSARAVPYRERYLDESGEMETPAEYLQKAAEEDEAGGN